MAENTHLNTGEIVLVPAPEWIEIKEPKTVEPLAVPTKKTWAEELEEEENEIKAQKEKDEQEMKKKWYVIFNGSFRGIYKEWHIVAQHIQGKNVIHKSYPSREEAEKAYKKSFKEIAAKEPEKEQERKKLVMRTPPVQISRIPTSREIEDLKKVTSSKFREMWASTIEYGESETLLQFYPKI
ncbi:hypothetical protein K1719_045700 [Acacia pycnantha]|nr:hypothetical protein K1719_045700 [Acacia pycnantha]